MSTYKKGLYQKPVYGIDSSWWICEIIHMRPRPRNKPESIAALQQFYIDVGMRIRTARIRANNMTQRALAVEVGLTRTSLTNIEKGRQKLLLHTLAEIAGALAIEPVDLLPKSVKPSNTLSIKFPPNVAPEEQGFVERAIGSGGPYEHKTITSNRNGSRRPSLKKQNIKRAS